MAETKLGLALLGSGRMAHVYGPKINEHPNLRLEVVYNPNLTSAAKAASAYGGTASDDIDAVLADTAVDAVIVATPTNTHFEITSEALRAFIEKNLDNEALYGESMTLTKVEKVATMLA